MAGGAILCLVIVFVVFFAFVSVCGVIAQASERKHTARS
jgi:hypothetical protein